MAMPGQPSEEPQEVAASVANRKPSRDGGREPTTTGRRGDLAETPATKKQLVIARDAALYVGLAQQTLAKMRVTGGSPPYYKVGRQVLYDKADLEPWLSVRRRHSTSEIPTVAQMAKGDTTAHVRPTSFRSKQAGADPPA